MGSCFELCSLQPPGALSCAVQTCGVSELAWPRVELQDTTGLKIALGLAVLAEGTLKPHVVPRGEVPDSVGAIVPEQRLGSIPRLVRLWSGTCCLPRSTRCPQGQVLCRGTCFGDQKTLGEKYLWGQR